MTGDYIRRDIFGNTTVAEIDELTEKEIQHIKQMFSDAAVRARKAGFDGIQIHAAHGFFLSRFFSPCYNHRKDVYGGTSKNRAKFLVDILDAIRKVVPSLHITIKINFHDYMPNGVTPSDAFIACQLLAEHGIDSIEISANGTSRTGIIAGKNEAYFLEFAKLLKQSVKVPIILVGGHRTVENMNYILNDNEIEYFSLSRPLIHEPDLPNRWNADKNYLSKCISCNGCYHTFGNRCVFSKNI